MMWELRLLHCQAARDSAGRIVHSQPIHANEKGLRIESDFSRTGCGQATYLAAQGIQ